MQIPDPILLYASGPCQTPRPQIDTDFRSYTLIKLGDDSVVDTIDQIHTSSIEISDFHSFEMSFHILPGLLSYVIYSKQFLNR